MRASQSINPGRNRKLSPAQQRLSAGTANRLGLRYTARRQAIPEAKKTEIATAFAGAATIVMVLLGLMSL